MVGMSALMRRHRRLERRPSELPDNLRFDARPAKRGLFTIASVALAERLKLAPESIARVMSAHVERFLPLYTTLPGVNTQTLDLGGGDLMLVAAVDLGERGVIAACVLPGEGDDAARAVDAVRRRIEAEVFR